MAASLTASLSTGGLSLQSLDSWKCTALTFTENSEEVITYTFNMHIDLFLRNKSILLLAYEFGNTILDPNTRS